MGSHLESIRSQIEESCRVKRSFSDELLARIEAFGVRAAEAFGAGRKLIFFGNGGSAADAQHLAAELLVRLQSDRSSLPALALTTNPSVLTAASNDYAFEQVFSRQVESLAERGDIVVAISTSGKSPNVVRGVQAAGRRGAYRIALTGETGGALADQVDLLVNVPSRNAQRIQEAHITIGHIVCSLVEDILFPKR